MKFLMLLSFLICSPLIMAQTDEIESLVTPKPGEDFDTRLKQETIDGLKKTADELFRQAVEESKLAPTSAEFPDREFSGFLPADLRVAHYSIVKDLIENGKLRQIHVDGWLRDHKALDAVVVPPAVVAAGAEAIENFWKEQYRTLFDNFFRDVQSNPPQCLTEGGNSTINKCCKGLISAIELNKPKGTKKCGESAVVCNQNTDCCSGYCDKDDPDQPGTCKQKNICYKLNELGQSCGNPSPYCREGSCESFDKNITGLLECKNTGAQCGSDDDCCSTSCVNSRCAKKLQCLNCRKADGKLEKGETCCPGFLPTDGGRCLPPIPPYVPSVQIKSKSILDKIVSLIFPSAHAEDASEEVIRASDEELETLTAGQQQFLTTERNKCNNAADKEACEREVIKKENEFVKDQFTGLTQAQFDEIEKEKNECNQMPAATACDGDSEDCKNGRAVNPEYEKCMTAVGLKEEKMIADNKAKGIKGISLKQADLINRYQIPGVTAKTYSDINKCEFNSFNDSWRDASARERNAEVFLRSFEFVYSNKGTQDFWEEGSKGNIFTRANRIAIKLRENRKKMLERMHEIDRKMACKCIAIFGPSKFDGNKQNFFNSQCAEEVAELQQSLGADLQDQNANLDGEDSKIDGSSINSGNSESKLAETEEVDKGAIGISHGKLLVDFLQLRTEVQVDRFTDNSDLEEELDALAEYIENKDFSEVFIDKWDGKKPKKRDGNNPRGNSHGLYGWGYTYYSGIIGFFKSVIAGHLAIFTLDFERAWKGITGKLKFGRVGGMTVRATGASGLKAAWAKVGKKSAAPKIKDRGRKRKKVNKWGKRAKGYERYFIGPRYVNTEAVRGGPNVCEVMGRASSCVRTAYVVDIYETGTSTQEGDAFTTYLLDPTQPLFVADGVIATTNMPDHNKNWVQMINDASEKGIKYLQSKKGGKYGSKGLTKHGGGWSYRGKKFKFYKSKPGDILTPAIKKGYFVPKARNSKKELYVPKQFGDLKDVIISAAKKYALCKELNGCPQGRGAEHLEGGELGFGYLFETKSEAQDFAEYTYEMHYKWPKLSSKHFIGYPAAGLIQYFNAVSGNLKLAGTLASVRSIQSFGAAQAYYADWKQRVSEYNSLGQAATGESSRNIRFSPRFFEALGQINFDGQRNDINALQSNFASIQQSGSLAGAEVNAFNQAVSSAIRRNKDIDKAEKFAKAAANASDATKKIIAENKKSLNKLNAPLERFSVAKLGGGGRGFKKLNNVISNLNKSIKALNKSRSGGNATNSFGSPFAIPKGPQIDLSSFGTSSAPSYESKAPSTINNNIDTGLNGKQVGNLLDKLSKEDLQSNENDTLFTVVSKAYKRNYSRVLRRTGVRLESAPLKEEKKINDKSKEELRKLLEN